MNGIDPLTKVPVRHRRMGVRVSGVSFGVPSTHRRLAEVDLTARPGELVAIIGPSGAGKSTLLEVLAGLLPASAGNGMVGGVPLGAPAGARRGRVGYVPQAESLHRELSARQELLFIAALRDDAERGEHAEQVVAVLESLGISTVADRPIRTLSGGERKRVTVATELLGDPDVLLLDEPTTGLDAGNERALMRTFRDIADTGRVVVVVTHSLMYLDLCDRVLMLGPGGKPVWWGVPSEMLSATGADSFVDLFDRAETLTPAEPDLTTSQVDGEKHSRHCDFEALPERGARRWRVFELVVQREFASLFADRRSFWLLAAQAPLLGLIVRAMNRSPGLDLGAMGVNLTARRILLTLVLCAIWLGSIHAVYLVVRDRPVIRRERLAGVASSVVLGAKLTRIAAVTFVQCVVLVVVALAGTPTRGSGVIFESELVELAVDLWIAAFAAGCVGLAISAFARSTDHALVLLPLILVPQLILSGGVIALRDTPALRPLSYVSTARWALSAVASSADLRGLETETKVPVPLSAPDLAIAKHEDADGGWDPTPTAWTSDVMALIGIGAASMVLAGAEMRRRA